MKSILFFLIYGYIIYKEQNRKEKIFLFKKGDGKDEGNKINSIYI